MTNEHAFTRRADGVYIGDEKIAHLVDPGGHVRMAAGKGDLREDVVAYLATKPDVSEPGQATEATPAPAASEAPSDGGAAGESGAPPADFFGASEAPAATPTPTPAAPFSRPATPTPQPARTPAPAQSSEIPPKPEGHPFKGDKDPLVIDWYRNYDPEGFARKYKGTRSEFVFPDKDDE